MSKIKSYLGFCQKAGDLVIGFNNLEKIKGGAHLIIMDSLVAENTQKKVKKISQKLNCPVLLCNNLSQYVGNGIKILAMKNYSLANAVITNQDENFTLMPKEVTNGWKKFYDGTIRNFKF